MENRIGDTHKCPLCGEEIQNGLINWSTHLDNCKGNQPVIVKCPSTIDDYKELLMRSEKERRHETGIQVLNPRLDNLTIPDEWLAELLKDNPEALKMIHSKTLIDKEETE